MQSTETLMKFGFMSMSLTYFSSLNMIRAMRATGALETILAGKHVAGGPMAMIAQAGQPGGVGGGSHKFTPTLKGAALPGQEEEDPRAWSVEDVGEWLSSLALGQYRESFADAAVDGAFLLDLNDEDLRNTLGIDHALHRKKILNSVRRLAVTVQAARVAEGGVVASVGGGGSRPLPVQQPAPAPAPVAMPAAEAEPAVRLATFAELVALASAKRDLKWKHALEHSIRVSRLACTSSLLSLVRLASPPMASILFLPSQSSSRLSSPASSSSGMTRMRLAPRSTFRS